MGHLNNEVDLMLKIQFRNVIYGFNIIYLNLDPTNRESFSSIQKSILLLCLDKPVFLNKNSNENLRSEAGRNVLHGGGYLLNSSNRWFDKTLQIIVSSDGACGINYEHTTAEAIPLLNMVDYAYKHMKANTDDLIVPKSEVCQINEIKFELDKKSVEEIDASKNNIESLVNDLEFHSLSFSDFGKTKIKDLKTSPDAFIQTGIQLGYYNLHNCPGSTYESGSLRRYKLGRTDTIRTCSPELIEFCKSVHNPNINVSEQKNLLLKSIERHVNYSKEVLMGQGFDRHLLGLKLIALENKRNIPDLFMDTSYSKACHHVLSTSQTSAATDLSIGYGPLVPDGYGFCYNIRPDNVNFSVSCVHSSPSTNALSLARSIENAWRKIIELLKN